MVMPLEGDRSEIAGDPMDADEAADSFQLAMPDGVDEQQVLDLLFRDLRRGEHAKAILAEAQAVRAAEWQKGLEHRAVDGMGQVVLRVPLESYLYWTAREGVEFWGQQSNIDYIARLNPGLVPHTRFKPQVTVDRELPSRPTRGGRWAA